MHTNPHIQIPDLLKEVDHAVKKRALQYLCRGLGRRKWKQRRRPELKPEHAVKRLEWARRHEHFTVENWKRIKWSDECSIERGKGIQPIWTFLRPSEQLIQGDVQEK